MGLSRTAMRFPCRPEHEHDKTRSFEIVCAIAVEYIAFNNCALTVHTLRRERIANAWFSRSWKCRVLAAIVEGMPTGLEGILLRPHGETAANTEASCDHSHTHTNEQTQGTCMHAVGGKSQTVWLTMTI